jgi:N-acetylglucosaminyldiphosphoundecaprenol N-acetyl-beta-D-mannosaminyltransferase
MERILRICAAHEFRPYLLGARRSVLDRAVVNALHRWPGLSFAGYRDGYFRPEDEERVVEEIRFCAPDCLFIGMPTPRKERFLHQYRDVLGVPFIMGVGGGIDVLAGHVRRAPGGIQRAGLEWLYRTYQEPRRMWWRYASTNAVFAGLLGKEIVARAFGRRGVSGQVRGDHA